MDIRPNLNITAKPWYKKTWGILLIFFGLIVILVIFIFLAQVSSYTKEINLGNIKTEGITKIQEKNKSSNDYIFRSDLETMDDPFIGNPDAEIVIVEFGDFECPFCGRAFPIVREIQTQYKDKVLFIWRDLPLRDIHPNAQKAAEAGECAHEQGKFWEYHDRLFINQNNLSIAALKNYASQIGLNTQQFDLCLDSGKYFQEVDDDLQTALRNGAEGTPTFFINGERASGVIPRNTFKSIIDQLLISNK